VTFSYRVVTATIKWLVRVLCRIDDAQVARVPLHGPLIIVVNHVNFFEVPALYTHMLPRRIVGLAKAESWNNPFKRVLANLWGAIPLHRGEPDTKALRQALDVLEAGGMIVIAPEGTRSGDGRLQRGHPGAVLLALRSGAPILPVVFYGAEHFWHNLAHLRRSDFHFVVGEPFHLHATGAQVTRGVRREMIDEIMYQMAALLPPQYRGLYADLGAAPRGHLRFPSSATNNPARA
jgi:1-acyl-sn-glycerol-3-phosphate acyltransferase